MANGHVGYWLYQQGCNWGEASLLFLTAFAFPCVNTYRYLKPLSETQHIPCQCGCWTSADIDNTFCIHSKNFAIFNMDFLQQENTWCSRESGHCRLYICGWPRMQPLVQDCLHGFTHGVKSNDSIIRLWFMVYGKPWAVNLHTNLYRIVSLQ